MLPVIGKVLEKLIAGRLRALVNHHPLSSDRQFGFRPGKSTEDALVELNRIVKETRCKYAVGLLFDTIGAFNNVWWPSILQNLKERDCPRNLYGLIQSYLSGKKAEIVSSTQEEVKLVTKGCPQGSVLGPLFWNLIFDEFVEDLRREENEAIAFADDLIVVIEANNRKGLEMNANDATRHCRNGARNKN